MTIENLSDKLIERLFDDSKISMLSFYQYIHNNGNDYRESLGPEERLEFTFDLSLMVSRLVFCLSYFIAFKCYREKEITFDRLIDFTDNFKELPQSYASDVKDLKMHKNIINSLYNSAVRHRDTLIK